MERVPHDYRTYKEHDLIGAWMACKDAAAYWDRVGPRGLENGERCRAAMKEIEDELVRRGPLPDAVRPVEAKSPPRLP